MIKPAEEMKPNEIIRARDISSCAFIPVSPCFEWHSFHLPLGTDALISESICAIVSEKIGGIYFRPLSFGLDVFRNKKQLKEWGFNLKEKIFGMNFPDLPLTSEYCKQEEMIKTIIFDNHGVITSSTRDGATEKFAKYLGVTHDEFERVWDTLEGDADEGKFSRGGV